jgi:hypothetical protein
MTVMKRTTYILAVTAIFTASCAANKPVEKKPSIAAEAEPVKDSRPAEIPSEPGKIHESRKETEKPAEAPSGESTEATAEFTEEEWKQIDSIAKDLDLANSMYQDYFKKRDFDGTQNLVLLKKAFALMDSIFSKLEEMLMEHPGSPMIEEMFSTVAEKRRNLLLEQP